MHYVTVDSCPTAINPADACVIHCDGEIHLPGNSTEINQNILLWNEKVEGIAVQNSSTLLFTFFLQTITITIGNMSIITELYAHILAVPCLFANSSFPKIDYSKSASRTVLEQNKSSKKVTSNRE